MTETIHGLADPLGFVKAWRRKQLEYALISNSLGQARIPFETLTQRSLEDTLVHFHLEIDERTRSSLLDVWLHLQPWPEASAVLNALKARGYTLGLLSNGDSDALQDLSTKLPPVIDHIFSSEQAGYYKPHPGVYALPLQSLGLQADEILHVAGSPTDVLGARAAGLPCAWSNREQQAYVDPSYKANYEMKNLSGLLEILELGNLTS